MTIDTPSLEYSLLSPMIIVLAAAVIGVLVEAFVPADRRRVTHLVLALGALAAAFAAVVALAGTSTVAAVGSVAVDGPTLFLQGVIVAVSAASVVLMAHRSSDHPEVAAVDAFTPAASTVPGTVAEARAVTARVTRTEIYPLTLFAVGGMMVLPASNDLLSMFVALEVLSLPLYLLCGLARRRRLLSQEASLKYFLLGAFSSAFFLFGTALLYGYAGSVRLDDIADVADGDQVLGVLGVGLVAVGLLFKVGAVPFHSWIPDVYQGAPTPVTAFMASATKVAAFGALLRILVVGVPDLQDAWRPMLWAVAIVTMLVGAVIAVTQTDVTRMLAYSSIAHAGFILTGVSAGAAGVSATLFYLAAYAFSTLGAFAVVSLVRDQGGEVTELSRWAGLGRSSPLTAAAFALFLLAFAGIPLTSGFTSKFAVFQAALEDGGAALVIVGVVSSAIAASFYIRVIVVLFFTETEGPSATITHGTGATVAVAVSAVATVVLGVFPQPLLDLAERAAAAMV
ncbi:NADH-quinone oxidoreductase subunit NuoN [Rhodococcus sp. UNC23MFCrub1.1]|uniref:NADH-quinone oxidoreductase subunit NuoN n=1 Tax=Rhodococcus sp. UNC23MFCrub1.1 TaxID=1449068 RepID=UPI00048047B5|nr:NADH-quinone oxidoreductase subunit NuoN [Rhodococcus sp. UNC23MFCrub1.1]